MKDKILVSACLMGFQVRYNGSHKARLANALSRWQSEGRLVTHCSPTCGSQFIYDGTFNGQRKPGAGVAAALLREYGITVFSELQLPQLLAWMEQRESDDDSM